ncbi:alpha/beta hydrolase [Dyella dinghuensis]|uniref:Alpha/beta hydrolase n=1 Tax=Dyella dinghuensis TaxID=1920169 RepID=A0A3S0RCD8_9GAMM|nr:alpha/beta hydrolase [Dyella dinghuensis]RUL61543.1 alpha/beta hydrolase [Dyella dinghuensis]
MIIGWVVVAVIGALVLLSAGLMFFTLLAARYAEKLVPPIGTFVDVDGARLHFVDRGAGPVIVMVHGLAGNLRNFYALIERLSVDHRVVAVDRPGCGYSTMRSGEHPSMRAQAALIAQLIRKLHLGQPTVVGHSMGGALSLALAIDHPDCVRALALIAPLSNVERAPPNGLKILRIKSPLVQWMVAWMFSAPIGKLIHRESLKAVFAPEAAVESFDTSGGAVLGLRPWAFSAACKDMVAISREMAAIPPSYPTLTIPVSVIFGRQDAVLNHETHGEQLVAALPNGNLHVMEGGGHMILVTQPDHVADLIRQSTHHRSTSSA